MVVVVVVVVVVAVVVVALAAAAAAVVVAAAAAAALAVQNVVNKQMDGPGSLVDKRDSYTFRARAGCSIDVGHDSGMKQQKQENWIEGYGIRRGMDAAYVRLPSNPVCL